MKNTGLDGIIEDIDSYLNNLKRFYVDKIYIDSKDESYVSVLTIREGKAKYSSPLEKGESKPKIEYDLFGNVINQKEEWEFSNSLDEMYSLICECQKCPLGQTRNKFVFGTGDPKADIVLIGEAPGAEEDQQGEPFVGRAGQLLNKILEATGFKREEVYICNILKCRPPGNRNPHPEEIETCTPYLDYQLKLINPKIIIALGRIAAETLLKTRLPLNKLRCKIHYYNGIKTFVTFHPAALLRNPQWKRPTWEDMQQFKKIYEELK